MDISGMLNEGNIDGKLQEADIPLYMHDGIKDYLFNRLPPGSFLQAVFENSLVDAVACADSTNLATIASYARFMYWELPARGPGSPWGSPEAVQAWLNPTSIMEDAEEIKRLADEILS